ncbi:MAG TPA: hypothetical protein VI588_01450, partial [Candidatus Gracilibacteria bacterium]|nr:hypothetical protein [Candidatus Gracilibacteria bacterium]
MKTKNKKNRFREFIRSLAVFMAVTSLLLLTVNYVGAQDLQSTLGELNEGVQLPGFGAGSDQSPGHSEASYQPGASGITSAIYFIV